VSLGILVLPAAAQAGALRVQMDEARAALVAPAGERARAAATGAIVGGAVGVLLGSALSRNPPPPPPGYVPRVVEEAEIVEAEPVERVVVERRRPRRVVEIEEAAPEPIEEEEECVTRRSRTYNPRTGTTTIRRERECD
jgi:hypothetical protein